VGLHSSAKSTTMTKYRSGLLCKLWGEGCVLTNNHQTEHESRFERCSKCSPPHKRCSILQSSGGGRRAQAPSPNLFTLCNTHPQIWRTRLFVIRCMRGVTSDTGIGPCDNSRQLPTNPKKLLGLTMAVQPMRRSSLIRSCVIPVAVASDFATIPAGLDAVLGLASLVW